MSGGEVQWSERAVELARRFPIDSLHETVLHWLDSRPGPERAGVACSGGADSLTLLLLLWAHLPGWREHLTVLHFDHRLRGEHSTREAEFVGEVARALGMAFRTGAWERDESEGCPSENDAREARFRFFAEAFGGEPVPLFLGHQRDDIAESQLMRLSRGSGTAGLAAPRPVHRFPDGQVRLRPLLGISGTEIRTAMEELGIPFCRDASNDGRDYYRNRIRLDVLPAWRRHSPSDLEVGAAASRELLEEDDEALEVWWRELMPPPEKGEPYDLGPLAGKPVALLRRALRAWLVAEGLAGHLAKAAFDRLLEDAAAGRSCRMSAGDDRTFVELDGERKVRKTVRPAPGEPLFGHPWPLPTIGTICLPGGGSLEARVFPLDSGRFSSILSGRVESRTTAYCAWRGERLSVRHWLAGDRYRPLGSPGSRKLQDIFGDRKIPAAERCSLPVVVSGSEILWVPALPPAENSKVKPGTKEVVRLTYSCGKAV